MSRTLLIVDGVDVNRQSLTKILGSEYDARTASNGREALEMMRLADARVSAVLLDLSPSAADGLETLREMRSDEKLMRIPVLVMTDGADAEDEALRLGASDSLERPYRAAAVRRRVANAVRLSESAAALREMKRDRLTGLDNRESFLRRAAELVAEAEPGAYCMSSFDIDNFKVINDQYGTEMGDAVLCHVARCIGGMTEDVGGVCCRVMADNFAVLYPAARMEDPAVRECYRAAAAPPCLGRPVTIRVGRYIAIDKSLSASAMYDRATLAQLSVRGRYDQYVALYDESMRNHLLEEQRIVTEMDDALHKGEFEAWFQPQYNHATGALVGAEALARWRRTSENRLVPPAEFIPVFERNGFIYEVDKFVWEKVCALLRKWIDENRAPLPISVNISRHDLLRADFFETITGLLDRYRVPVNLLRLEVTESAFAGSAAQIIQAVRGLIDYGFTVEIDDFGSGYSSLNTLKDVPATILKLDMKFLQTTGDSERGGSILESIVRMSRWLGMLVIAEGVETQSQADFLASVGCNFVQGYLYARPMPVEEYEKLARRSEKESAMPSLQTVETLDRNAFWDPKSMDTLIFNSYIGGACIFEFRKGVMEILRVNDNYARELGVDYAPDAPLSRLHPARYLDEANLAKMTANIEKAIREGRESACEVAYAGRGGRMAYMRCTVRALASTDDMYLCYTTVTNVTAQREAERAAREAAAQMQAIMDHVGSGVTATPLLGEKPRFLFANDRYFEILGYTRAQYEAEIQSNYNIIVPEDREAALGAVRRVGDTGAPAVIEFRAARRDGSVVWVRSILSVARFDWVEGPVQLSIMTDISNVKRAERALRENYEQLRFLNETSRELLAQADGEMGIDSVLRKLLRYFGGSRAYIYEFDPFGRDADNVRREVCAEGVVSRRERLSGVPSDEIRREALALCERHGGGIAVLTQTDADEDDRRILVKRGLSALIKVPLRRADAIIGFIGVDDPSERLAQANNLAAIGDYIAVMMTRRDRNAQIRSDNEALLALMNDMPGGFVRLRAMPDGGLKPVYANDGFCELVGMTLAELRARYAARPLDIAHPDDAEAMRDAIRVMTRVGKTFGAQYRFAQRNGRFIRLSVFGRMTKNESGDRFLNLYFTDLSEQEKREADRRELLENLPCGAGIYEAAGTDVRATYLNRRYISYFPEREIDLSDRSVLDVVHPDDRDSLRAAFRAMRDGRGEGACDIRIPDGAGGYRPFHAIGYVAERADDRMVIYVTYTPITRGEMTLRETLPLVISAMMGATTDIAFVKDRDFRYLSCSARFAYLAGREKERDVIGKTDYDLFPPDTADKFRREDERLFTDGQSIVDMVEWIPSRDGIAHYANTSKYLLCDAAGNVVGMYGVSRDITEYRSAFEQLKLLTNSIPGGLATYEIGASGMRMLYCSDGYYRHTGYAKAEYMTLAKANPLCLVYPEDMPQIRAAVTDVLAGGDSFGYEYRARSKNGGYRWLNVQGVVVERHEDAAVVNLVKFDVTERKNAEEKLRMSEEQYRLAQRHSGSMLCRYDVRERAIAMSAEAALLFGTPEVVENVPYGMVRCGAIEFGSESAFVGFFEEILHGQETGTAEFNMKTVNGWRWMKAVYSTIFTNDGVAFYAIVSFKDVTDRHKQAEERQALIEKERILQEKAEIDGMTGIYNRDTAESIIRRQMREGGGKPRALLIADLDNLKTINDRLGHPQGDAALRAIASSLKARFAPDGVVGRFGGDEFVVFLDGMGDRRALGDCATELNAKMRMIRVGGREGMSVCASFGITVDDAGQDTFDDMYRKADKALYFAKQSGKRQFAIYSQYIV